MSARFPSPALRLLVPWALFCAVALSGSRASAQTAASTEAVSNSCDTRNLLSGKAPVESQNINGDLGRVTDGAASHEGAAWDAPTAITFMGAGSLTYDLGEPQSVGAAYLQADANDTYRLSGSLDGSPG